VDELDRCRPTYAIQTLELVKHLFNVPGLIFIFALDIEQLSHSVQTVYGQNMDAQGYLCRFFDYFMMMTYETNRNLVDEFVYRLYKTGFFSQIDSTIPDSTPQNELLEYILNLTQMAALS
jgi:predicted KAP-like P-loop ATPase